MMQNAALPDPGALFDSLMARKEFEPHPNKISSILFYLASIIIHGKSTQFRVGFEKFLHKARSLQNGS